GQRLALRPGHRPAHVGAAHAHVEERAARRRRADVAELLHPFLRRPRDVLGLDHGPCPFPGLSVFEQALAQIEPYRRADTPSTTASAPSKMSRRALPVGVGAVAAAEVRSLPVSERLARQARLVDLDAEARAVRHGIGGPVQPDALREYLVVVEAESVE